MRLYHFLSAKNALGDLANKRIRLSEIDKLNDPFELWCSSQEDRQIRRVLRRWKKAMALQYGMLCFSRNWTNPVLWSHYADSHRGICLGFEVDEESISPVSYVSERTPLSLPLTQDRMKQLLFTKYRDWGYEEEFRAWFPLDTRDASGHCFYDFDDKVQLREVLAGPLCDTRRETIDAALKSYVGQIFVAKTRLAFRTFRVVKNPRGFRR